MGELLCNTVLVGTFKWPVQLAVYILRGLICVSSECEN